MLKKILIVLIVFLGLASQVNAAPFLRWERTLLPVDSTENLGTTTSPWDEFHVNQICLSTSCRTSWPTGGSGGSGTFATSTAWGSIFYNYPLNASDVVLFGYDGAGVATSTNEAEFSFDPIAKLGLFLQETKVGIGTTSPYAPLSVVGQAVAAYFTATTTTASTFPLANITKLSNLTSNGFIKTSGGDGTLSVDTVTYESGLTAGDGLTRTVNDFDCDIASGSVFGCLTSANWTTFNNKQDTITAGDALTLTGTDIDFDGGVTPSGDLGGTWASPSVTDDSHAHTGTTLSGIDISDDTNLTAGDALTLTGDDIDFDGGTAPGGSLGGTWASPTIDDLFILNTGDVGTGSYTFPYASTTALTVSGALYNSSLSDGCLNVTSGLIGSTGSACGAGGSSAYDFPLAGNATSTLTQFNGGLTSYASTTIGNGTAGGGLTVNGITSSSFGDATTPGYTFNGDTNSGLYDDAGAGGDKPTITAAGNRVFSFNNSLNTSYRPLVGQTSKTFYLRADAGALATPTYAFDNDVNTGIWSSGADLLSLTTGGIDRVNILDTGNVGVGTTTPFTDLSVNGQIAGNFFTGLTNNLSSFLGGITTTKLDVSSLTATTTIRGPIEIGANSRDNGIAFTSGRIYPSSTSVGGAWNLTNTSNTGAGLVIYSNAGVSNGRLLNIRADNDLFNQPALHIDYDGVGNAFEISASSTQNDATPLTITNRNWTASTIGVSSDVENHGIIKSIHTFPASGAGASGNDSVSSHISLDSQGIGTAVQGIFMTSTTVGGGTTGKLLNLRNRTAASNNEDEYLTLTYNGKLGLLDSSPSARLDVVSTSTDDYMYLSTTNSANGNIFTVKNNGNVGIGTTSPYAKLSVVGEVVGAYFTATSTTATSTFYGDINKYAYNGTSLTASLKSITGTSLGMGDSNYVGQLQLNNPSNSGNNTGGVLDFAYGGTTRSRISTVISGATSAGMNFWVSNAGTLTKALSLNSVGTASFTATPTIATTSTVIMTNAGVLSESVDVLRLMSSNTNVNNNPLLVFSPTTVNGGTAQGYRAAGIGSKKYSNTNADFDVGLSFFTYTGTGGGSGTGTGDFTEQMVIDHIGNVGIGSTTPGTLLSLGNTGNDTINISTTATSTFGSGINLRSGCFSVADVCVGLNTSNPYTWTALQQFSNASTTLLSSNYTDLFSSLRIPTSTNPTIATVGAVAINTTQASTSIRYHDGTAERMLSPSTDETFIIASSTLSSYKGLGATSTISWGVTLHSETWTEIGCMASTTGTGGLRFGDNTGNFMEYVPISSTPSIITLSTNNSFIRGEAKSLQVRAETTLTQDISCTVSVRKDAD